MDLVTGDAAVAKDGQAAQAHDFYPRQEFNIASEASHEMDGLIGTFAKPSAQTMKP